MWKMKIYFYTIFKVMCGYLFVFSENGNVCCKHKQAFVWPRFWFITFSIFNLRLTFVFYVCLKIILKNIMIINKSHKLKECFTDIIFLIIPWKAQHTSYFTYNSQTHFIKSFSENSKKHYQILLASYKFDFPH